MSEPVESGQKTEWPQSLIWALFDTMTGAAEALEKVQTAHEEWLITNENSAVIVKDQYGTVTFQETEDLSGLEGAKNGIILGATLGMLTPNTSMWTMMGKGALWLGFGGRLHDAGFEDNQIRAVGEQMPPSSSALIALVTHHWADDVIRYLNQIASKVGWVVVSEQMGQKMQKAKAEANAMDAA
jgi:uncharacterized membrane protein